MRRLADGKILWLFQTQQVVEVHRARAIAEGNRKHVQVFRAENQPMCDFLQQTTAIGEEIYRHGIVGQIPDCREHNVGLQTDTAAVHINRLVRK